MPLLTSDVHSKHVATASQPVQSLDSTGGPHHGRLPGGEGIVASSCRTTMRRLWTSEGRANIQEPVYPACANRLV